MRKVCPVTKVSVLTPDGRTITLTLESHGATISGLANPGILLLDRTEIHAIGDLINTWRDND